MKRKIFIGMFIIAIVSVFGTAILSSVLFYNELKDKMNKQVVAEATYIKEGYEADGSKYLERLSISPNASGDRVTVISKDGTVIYDNVADISSMENHADRPEVKEALKNGYGETTRLSDTVSEETYYYAVRLSDNSVLRVGNTMGSVFSRIAEMLPWAICIAIVMLIVSIVIARIKTCFIVKPINEIDLETPENNNCYDELSPLLLKIKKQRERIDEQIAELSQKREEFIAITENMSEGFVTLNNKHEVLSYNKSALDLFGIENEFADGDTVFKLNRSTEFFDAVAAMSKGKTKTITQVVGERYIQIIASPVVDNSRVTGGVIVVLDITDYEKQEEMRREFTANVSHELKTPLTSILGAAEIMKEGMVKPQDTVHFSENIYKEAQRLISLVQDIIKLSQIDEGRVDKKKEDVLLKELSGEVASALSEALERKHITLTIDGASGVVNGVKQMLFEMIYNICDNAIRYNNEMGSIFIKIAETQSEVKISIEDNGIGIPNEDRSRIFERFYRVDKSHSKETGGTGLGLSIVKHIAAFHNAKTEVESIVGKGTVISVIFEK